MYTMQITITLTDAQETALYMMGKDEDAQQAIAQSTFTARVKGDFKRYREAEKKVNAGIYDDSSKRGAKWSESKDDYLKRMAQESLAVIAEL
jgi:hypothetical protein